MKRQGPSWQTSSLQVIWLVGGIAASAFVIAALYGAAPQWAKSSGFPWGLNDILNVVLLGATGVSLYLAIWFSRKSSLLKRQIDRDRLAEALHMKSCRKNANDAIRLREEVDRQRAEMETLRETLEELRDENSQLHDQLVEASTQGIVEEIERYQAMLGHARDEFLAFLDGVSPLAERFGVFIATGEEGHEKIQRIISSLDGAAAHLGIEGDDLVLKTPIPKEPHALFSEDEAPLSDTELHKAYRRVAAAVHPDKVSRAKVSWLTAIFEALSKIVHSRYDELKNSSKADTW